MQQTTVPLLAFALMAASALPVANAAELYIPRHDPGGRISIVDAATGTELKTIELPGFPWAVAITPDGSKAYVTSLGVAPYTIWVIQTSTRTLATTINTPGPTVGIAVTPDGTRAYAASSSPGAVLVIDTGTDTIVGNIPVKGAGPVTLTPDGTQAYVTGQTADGSGSIVSIIDTASNTVTATVSIGDAPYNLVANNAAVYVAHSSSNAVSVIDRGSSTVSATIAVGSNAISGLINITPAITPDGSRAFFPNTASNSVSVIDTSSGTVVGTVPVSVPYGIAVSPDGTAVYVLKSAGSSVAVINTNVVLTNVNFTFSGTGAIAVKP